MSTAAIEQEFQEYMAIYKADAELGKIMSLVTFENIFNDEFLKAHSKFTSLDDLIWRSGFGIMNLLEVEQVNQEKWNAYIAANTECTTWHEFGKVAMIAWMKKTLELYKASTTN
ncbi:MAG: hypothetical protein RSE47_00050 [Acidaminococcaceae bacterium]